MGQEGTVANQLQKFKDLKSVPRPSKGQAAMFIHVLESGEEVLTCMFDDGRTEQMMNAQNTKAQLESLERKR